MTEHKRYTIENVSDFMAVPVEKLADCLKDFDVWLGMQHMASALGAALGGEIKIASNPEEGCSATKFVWIDDGQHIAHVTMRTPDGQVARRDIDFGAECSDDHA